MRHLLLTTFILLSLFACEREDDITINESETSITYQAMAPVKFKVLPTGPTQLQLKIDLNSAVEIKQVSVFEDSVLIGSFPAEKQQFGQDVINIEWVFDSGKVYDLRLENQISPDTIQTFTISNYEHIYLKDWEYFKAVELSTLLDYDLSPDRDALFFVDYVNNIPYLYRLWLPGYDQEALPEGISNGLLLRSINFNEFIFSSFHYEGRVLQADSIALYKYNHLEKDSSFVSFASQGYGRFSRVINDQMLITEPRFSAESSTLLDFSNGIKTPYNLDISTIRENNYEHIYLGNQIWDDGNNQFVSPMNLPDSASLLYYDEVRERSYVLQIYHDNDSRPYTRLAVYQRGELIFRDEYEKERFFTLPRLIPGGEEPFYIYQGYGYDTQVRLDGYYRINYDQQKLELVQTDLDGLNKADFYLKEREMLSVRHDGIYRIRRYE